MNPLFLLAPILALLQSKLIQQILIIGGIVLVTLHAADVYTFDQFLDDTVFSAMEWLTEYIIDELRYRLF